MNEKKLGELVREARAYQAKGETLKGQLAALQANMGQLAATLETLKGLDENKKDVLVPAGSGVYVKGKEIEAGPVMVNVGASVIVEKPVPETIKMLEKRKKATEGMMEKTEKDLFALSEELGRVDAKARKLVRGK